MDQVFLVIYFYKGENLNKIQLYTILIGDKVCSALDFII